MLLLDDQESFLRTIFDAPDELTPRLVYADWLEEHDFAAMAEFLRFDCQWEHELLAGAAEATRGRAEYTRRLHAAYPHISAAWQSTTELSPQELLEQKPTLRGFPRSPMIELAAEDLGDPEQLRQNAVRRTPNWYGATDLRIVSGMVSSAKPIQTLMTSTVFQNVTRFHCYGTFEMIEQHRPTRDESSELVYGLVLSEFEYRPVMTVQAVEALVQSREARRIVYLDLRNNDLDNDAARAIIRSNHLIRLQRLELFEGNQLRGKTWAQLQQRFAEGIVQ